MFKDDSNEMIKITYAGLASRSAAHSSVSHYLRGSRNRGDRDIYSIGSIAYQLLSGGREPPTSVDVHSDDEDDVPGSNNRHNLFLSPMWRLTLISKEAKSFIETAMQHGFLTVIQALQHRWITQEPVYLQGTGVLPLSDAKGHGYLVPTSVQNMEKHKEESESKEISTHDVLQVSRNDENVPGERQIDHFQEENSNDHGTILISNIELDSVTFDPLADTVETVGSSDSSSNKNFVCAAAQPTQSTEVEVEDASTLTLVVEPETASLNSQDTTTENLSKSESSDEESVGVVAPPNQPSDVFIVCETSKPGMANDVDKNTPVTLVSEPEHGSVDPQGGQSETVTDDEVSVTCDTDGSHSSDDESVGVAMAPPEPPIDIAEGDSSFPTEPTTMSLLTPIQLRKKSLSFKMRLQSSPSQTPADFRDLHDFLRQASNAEGDITMDELRERLRMLNKYTEEEVNSWFSGLHFDDSRNLSYQAILAEAIRSRRKIERLRAEEAFRTIDKGKQGFVTVGNLRAVLGTGNSDYIEKLMKEADTKRDGRITYDQFKEVLQRWNRTEI